MEFTMSDDVFRIEKRRNTGNYYLPHHYEHVYQLLLVTEGKILYHIGGQDYDVHPGDLVVLNTLDDHDLEVLEYPYERYILQIDPSWFQMEIHDVTITSLFVRRTSAFHHILHPDGDKWKYLLGITDEMMEETSGKKLYWTDYISADLKRMFICILRGYPDITSTGTDAATEMGFKILHYLDRHYLDNISVDLVASHFFLNKYYASHVFKDATGYSIMDYVISLKMNHAKRLLTETEESVSEIAQTCGYTDFTHFTKQFKKHAGTTPTKFRKEKKQNRPF